jgi:hypothetical protein
MISGLLSPSLVRRSRYRWVRGSQRSRGEYDGVQGGVGGSVATAVEPMTVGLSAAGRDRCDATQVGEGGFRMQPVWVVPGRVKADKTVMGASRTGSYEVTPPSRSRAGGATPPGRPILARTADFASVDGGSHPAGGAAYILPILTVDGMPHGSQRARSSVVARHWKGTTTPTTPS